MSTPTAPQALKVPHERTFHGEHVIDNYEWMRQKDDPNVIAHLNAENAFAAASTEHLRGLRESIFDEIKSHTLETDLSVPTRRGNWWYYSRSFEGKQYAVHARAPIADTDDWRAPMLEETAPNHPALPHEQVMLDGNAEAAGHDFFTLGTFSISSDGTRLAYATDTVGEERYTLRIRDLNTGEDLADVIPNTSPGAVFAPDGNHIFYTTVDDSWRPDTVWRHEVGAAASADVAVLVEPDERFWVDVGLTHSKKYLVIDVSSSVTSEVRVLDANDPTGEFRIVWDRRDDIEYSIEHIVVAGRDRLVILHNENAENFELVDVDADDPAGNRHVLLPHSDSVRLEAVESFASHLVVEYRREALSRVATIALTEHGYGTPYEILFDEPLFTVGVGSNPEWAQPTVRLGYGSLVTPTTIYDYELESGRLYLLKQQPVIGYDPALYTQTREWATASDGTRVPVSLVYRTDAVSPSHAAPLVLYGYGSYESSIDPAFSISRLSLLDRGVVFAIAHVRGGGEMGRSWYENGKKLSKKNTFTDFVAVARYLTDVGWTSADQLVAEGASAGGLLMGAAANIAPEAFSGILAGVPFVDALTSILDPSLPLTVIEWDEWGDPLHDSKVYQYMRTYSPYENVRMDVTYPPILAVTSLNDTRVLYVEPAKWVARLREAQAPVLLKTEMSAGHGGASGRYNAWEERAWELAWMLERCGRASNVN